ncbi:hypothetical protein NDU88_008411 [Pleurodeles waltl]|uniref:Uncharacterized protein n=1 Tax=Pleurodeles waltl TaxID=8319 RepID=A0AAV7PWK1_PLEWA|nr:hypothetical protein NDU88_008411 [Pleurodeles waltl]
MQQPQSDLFQRQYAAASPHGGGCGRGTSTVCRDSTDRSLSHRAVAALPLPHGHNTTEDTIRGQSLQATQITLFEPFLDGGCFREA